MLAIMPSKFKPTRERKRKVIARQSTLQPHAASHEDSNASIITASKVESEERRQKLRDELRAQTPKVSAKKQKRLDKYIEKKLKKDEAADLVKKLEKEKASIDARLKSGVKEQLDATREGLKKLLNTRNNVQTIKDEMQTVDGLCSNPENVVPTFDQISRVRHGIAHLIILLLVTLDFSDSSQFRANRGDGQ